MKRAIATLFQLAWKFLSWWLGELRSALDDLRAYLAPRWRRSVVIFVSRSRLHLTDPQSESGSPAQDIPRQQSGSPPTILALEPETAALLQGRRADIVFDPELAFVRTLEMPVAAVAHLESALELQKPKLLPLDAAALRTDFEIVTVDQERGSLVIELAALKRVDIEPIERLVDQWCLRPGAIQLGRQSDARPRFKFGASSNRTHRLATSRADRLWLASAATLLFCAAIVFAVQTVRAESSLTQALVESSADAAVVLEQRQQLISGLETLALLTRSGPTAAAILADVTTHLNRDAWITDFELKGADLRLVGLSPDPATTVKGLATSTLLTHVELHSSLSALAGVRFEITARAKAAP